MRKHCILLPLIILLAIPAFANNLHSFIDKINLTIKPHKGTYRLGEFIKIDYRISSFKNGMRIRYPGVWLPQYYGLKIEDIKGTEMKYSGPLLPDIIPYPEVELWESTYFGAEISIDSDWYNLKPGKYILYLVYPGLVENSEYKMIKSNRIELLIQENQITSRSSRPEGLMLLSNIVKLAGVFRSSRVF